MASLLSKDEVIPGVSKIDCAQRNACVELNDANPRSFRESFAGMRLRGNAESGSGSVLDDAMLASRLF